MTAPDDDLLVAPEGVDEGSADSTAEGPQDGGDPAGVLGAGPSGGPDDAATPRPPEDMESEQARAARDAVGTGQQVQVGEG